MIKLIILVVLIETYWNVKRDVVDAMQKTRQVLIETYWNVKYGYVRLSLHGVLVLIETYWNVKVYLRLLFVIPLFGINRNILECKDNRTRNLQYLGYSINRNILECKERNQGDR